MADLGADDHRLSERIRAFFVARMSAGNPGFGGRPAQVQEPALDPGFRYALRYPHESLKEIIEDQGDRWTCMLFFDLIVVVIHRLEGEEQHA
ncbi:MAG: hypothetical protein AB7I32_17695, partial [Gammaproteobacteria bacterium]